MKSKRLKSIAQVSKSQRYAVLAAGMESLVESVATLSADALDLGEVRHHQGAAVLRAFGDEEAAKILIMLDLARWGWDDQDGVDNLLFAFYDHLARGLYVEAYSGAPADLAEVRRFVDGARAEFYLDGPMDVDWIFGNRVLTGREEALYVDLIEDEDGTHRWTGPAERAAIYDEPFTNPAPCSIAVSLVKDMQRIGLLTEEGLQFTRDAWDGVTVTDAMHWSELRPITIKILEQLINAGRVLETDNDAVGSVLEHWIFPLSSVDLRMQKVSLKKLQEEREHRLARELGGY